ncbi:MAG: hypothetical protein FWG50_08000 [Kiritimatiellaeota bacterium]|nr:hypothetical protein [Kiritimatiellota bacterium]
MRRRQEEALREQRQRDGQAAPAEDLEDEEENDAQALLHQRQEEVRNLDDQVTLAKLAKNDANPFMRRRAEARLIQCDWAVYIPLVANTGP